VQQVLGNGEFVCWPTGRRRRAVTACADVAARRPAPARSVCRCPAVAERRPAPHQRQVRRRRPPPPFWRRVGLGGRGANGGRSPHARAPATARARARARARMRTIRRDGRVCAPPTERQQVRCCEADEAEHLDDDVDRRTRRRSEDALL
jgi:hypothetical protein